MNTLTRYGVLAALAAGLSFNSWLEGWSLGVFLFVVWILSHHNFLYLMYHTLGRDLRYDLKVYFVWIPQWPPWGLPLQPLGSHWWETTAAGSLLGSHWEATGDP